MSTGSAFAAGAARVSKNIADTPHVIVQKGPDLRSVFILSSKNCVGNSSLQTGMATAEPPPGLMVNGSLITGSPLPTADQHPNFPHVSHIPFP